MLTHDLDRFPTRLLGNKSREKIPPYPDKTSAPQCSGFTRSAWYPGFASPSLRTRHAEAHFHASTPCHEVGLSTLHKGQLTPELLAPATPCRQRARTLIRQNHCSINPVYENHESVRSVAHTCLPPRPNFVDQRRRQAHCRRNPAVTAHELWMALSVRALVRRPLNIAVPPSNHKNAVIILPHSP
ncbi:unnamed protein product [Ectocarpus sp. 13 AM-2016]